MATVQKNEIPVLWDVSPDQPTVYVEKLPELTQKPGYDVLKRIFDAVVSLLCLLVFLLPMAVIAAWIALDSPGNPIYSQVRLGKNEKPFVLYKFRSMRIDAEADGLRWAEDGDPRVTKLGRFLRRSRLDELPQLLNILLGQMSFVGPRPERPEFYEVFDRYIVGFRQRMLVKPGLTGHAQINGGYDLRPEEKILYDVEYIKNRSAKIDLKCMLKTVRVVLSGCGTR